MKEVGRLLPRPGTDACWCLLIIFRTLIDPIFEKLDLVVT